MSLHFHTMMVDVLWLKFHSFFLPVHRFVLLYMIKFKQNHFVLFFFFNRYNPKPSAKRFGKY